MPIPDFLDPDKFSSAPYTTHSNILPVVAVNPNNLNASGGSGTPFPGGQPPYLDGTQFESAKYTHDGTLVPIVIINPITLEPITYSTGGGNLNTVDANSPLTNSGTSTDVVIDIEPGTNVGDGLFWDGSAWKVQLNTPDWANIQNKPSLVNTVTVQSPLEDVGTATDADIKIQNGTTINQTLLWNGTNWVIDQHNPDSVYEYTSNANPSGQGFFTVVSGEVRISSYDKNFTLFRPNLNYLSLENCRVFLSIYKYGFPPSGEFQGWYCHVPAGSFGGTFIIDEQFGDPNGNTASLTVGDRYVINVFPLIPIVSKTYFADTGRNTDEDVIYINRHNCQTIFVSTTKNKYWFQFPDDTQGIDEYEIFGAQLNTGASLITSFRNGRTIKIHNTLHITENLGLNQAFDNTKIYVRKVTADSPFTINIDNIEFFYEELDSNITINTGATGVATQLFWDTPQGPGGGGGTVTDVTATAPLNSTGGATPNISIADGTTAGNTLIWNGTAWVEQSVPSVASGTHYRFTFSLTGGADPTPTAGQLIYRTDTQRLFFGPSDLDGRENFAPIIYKLDATDGVYIIIQEGSTNADNFTVLGKVTSDVSPGNIYVDATWLTTPSGLTDGNEVVVHLYPYSTGGSGGGVNVVETTAGATASLVMSNDTVIYEYITLTADTTITIDCDGLSQSTAPHNVIITQDATGGHIVTWATSTGDTLEWYDGVQPYVDPAIDGDTLVSFYAKWDGANHKIIGKAI